MRVVDDFLVHLAAAELKPVLQEGEVLALGAEFFHHLVETGAGGRIEAFELRSRGRLRPQDARPLGLHLAGADADLAGAGPSAR